MQLAGVAWLALSAPCLADAALDQATPAAPTRFPIRVDQVVAAAGAGLPLAEAAITLLARYTATVPEPDLQVTAVEPWGDRQARVRVACRARTQCLPFYVAAAWPTADAAAHALASSRAAAPQSAAGQLTRSAHPAGLVPALVPALIPATGPASALPVATRAAALSPAAGERVLRAGTHATLRIDAAPLHILLPVICLEPGEPGRTIRVTALDHKQTYFAQVVDATLLKGTL